MVRVKTDVGQEGYKDGGGALKQGRGVQRMGGRGGGSPEEHEEGQIGSKRTQRWRRTRKRKFVQGAEMS